MKNKLAPYFRVASLAVLLNLAHGCHPAPAPAEQAVVPGVEAFDAQIKKYVDATKPLRTAADQKVPKGGTPEAQAAGLEKRRAVLAADILALRANAKPGEMFTPEGAASIKKALDGAFKGPGVDTIRDAMEEQNDPTVYKVAGKVAMSRPIAAPLLPAVLTADLPQLPKEVEYHFVGRTLLLIDAEATSVLDFIEQAFPEPPPKTPAPPVPPPVRARSVPFLKMPQKARSVRFVAMGDTGTGTDAQRKMADTLWEYYSEGNRFKFILLLGDNLYAGLELAADYKREFLDPYKQFLDARIQFHACLGNHDLAAQVNFKPFNMGGHPYYSFTEPNVKFVALNSNDPTNPEQLKWLDEQFAGEKGWRICFFHHPLYSSGLHAGESDRMRSLLEKDLVKNQVNVVFSGHEHFYERPKLQQGIQYFVDGGGAKIRRDLQPRAFTAVGYDRENSLMILEIAGDEMFYQAMGVSGRTIDCGIVYRTPDASAKGGKEADTQKWLSACQDAIVWLQGRPNPTQKVSSLPVAH